MNQCPVTNRDESYTRAGPKLKKFRDSLWQLWIKCLSGIQNLELILKKGCPLSLLAKDHPEGHRHLANLGTLRDRQAVLPAPPEQSRYMFCEMKG